MRITPSSPARHKAAVAGLLLATLALFATACRVSSTEIGAADGTGAEGTEVAADNLDTDGGQVEADPDGGEVDSVAVDPPPVAPPSNLPRDLTVANVDCALPGSGGESGLTETGEAMFARYTADAGQLTGYELAVDIDPASGAVAGALRATIPTQDDTINFRMFAGMDAFNAGLAIDNVTWNGEPVDAVLEQALIRVPSPGNDGEVAIIELDFSYTIAQLAANPSIFGALSGESLQPDQVGLLGRTLSGMQLGHWFPVWLPEGTRSDPNPSGFGDIGAFPTGSVCATITVPEGYEVVTSGVRAGKTETSVIEAGAGLRDFSILISNNLAAVGTTVAGVDVRVWGPKDDPESMATVLRYAEQSQGALVEAFGPYPWKEIDLVSAPLGGGVGGMEWPGMVWIERSMFAGGLPGMGELGDLFGEGGLESLLGGVGGEALATSLEWTVAHELGHEWWHAMVGNDSIASPAVDEPLAQFSACIAMEWIHPDNWRAICDAQTTEQFAQARALGVADTAAEQASDAFDSSLQYGAVVYGKAPGFYFAAAELIGWDELVAALNTFVADNAFALVSTNELRQHLVDAAGANGAAIGDLWDRWFREARGDEDIEPSNALGGLGGLGGLDFENLDLEGLDLEGLDLEGLDVEGLDLENLEEMMSGLEGLLGEDGSLDPDFFSSLFEDLLEAAEDN